MLHGKNTSLTSPRNCLVASSWNRANLLYSASSNSTRRYCHHSYSYWRWASSTSTTWPGYLTMSHCGICWTSLPAPFPDMFRSSSKLVLLRHLAKGCSTDIIFPTFCWKYCRLSSPYRFFAFHYQQILWLLAGCLVQLDLIDIYHRLI